MATLRDYIAYRYNNWLDFARHMARVNNFEDWAEDLLNDVICDLLKKPAEKTNALMHRTTTKIVNGTPTTELDKFVLSMIRRNATSKVAPFRKNTLGHKVIDRGNNQITTCQHIPINHASNKNTGPDYDSQLNTRLEQMHTKNIHRLKTNNFTPQAIKLYKRHFIQNEPLETFDDQRQEAIKNIRNFLLTKKTLLDD